MVFSASFCSRHQLVTGAAASSPVPRFLITRPRFLDRRAAALTSYLVLGCFIFGTQRPEKLLEDVTLWIPGIYPHPGKHCRCFRPYYITFVGFFNRWQTSFVWLVQNQKSFYPQGRPGNCEPHCYGDDGKRSFCWGSLRENMDVRQIRFTGSGRAAPCLEIPRYGAFCVLLTKRIDFLSTGPRTKGGFQSRTVYASGSRADTKDICRGGECTSAFSYCWWVRLFLFLCSRRLVICWI